MDYHWPGANRQSTNYHPRSFIQTLTQIKRYRFLLHHVHHFKPETFPSFQMWGIEREVHQEAGLDVPAIWVTRFPKWWQTYSSTVLLGEVSVTYLVIDISRAVFGLLPFGMGRFMVHVSSGDYVLPLVWTDARCEVRFAPEKVTKGGLCSQLDLLWATLDRRGCRIPNLEGARVHVLARCMTSIGSCARWRGADDGRVILDSNLVWFSSSPLSGGSALAGLCASRLSIDFYQNWNFALDV